MAAISRTGEKLLNAFVSIGAAVVIFGAWQKILHASLADLFLTIGLLVEAAIFLIYGLLAFRGYGLDDSYSRRRKMPEEVSMAKGGLIPRLPADQVANLKTNFSHISEVAKQIRDLSVAVKASQHFGQEVDKASGAFATAGNIVKETANSMGQLRKAADQFNGIGTQTQQLSQNLTALNQVYQIEIQNSSKGLQSVGDFYASLSEVAGTLKESVKEADATKNEIAALANNLSQLNVIYGNMISAMKK